MTPPSKEALRARFRNYRNTLSPEEHASHSAAILRRVQALPELQNAGTVHVYWPRGGSREIDTRPLIRQLHQSGRQVALPCVVDYSGAAGSADASMISMQYTSEETLQVNKWGLREPCGTPRIPAEEIDLVVVPALGAGRNGHRVGYGGGFYDAFLQDLSVLTLGLVYAACLLESVPVEPHDVPLSILVTEEETLRL